MESNFVDVYNIITKPNLTSLDSEDTISHREHNF